MNSSTNKLDDPDCNTTNHSAIYQRSDLSQVDNNLGLQNELTTAEDDAVSQLDEQTFNDVGSLWIEERNNETNKDEQNDHENKNLDYSTSATAFTITLEDEDVGPKKFGIRDSIRKFAPPKLFTKPTKKRESGDIDNDHDVNVDSGSASLPFNRITSNSNFNRNNKSRSSHNSKYSSVNDSVTYLMDKMLDLKQKSTHISSSINHRPTNPHQQDSLDNCDNRSDNGTYIVGEDDQELQADREKIDELFGVVKKAEQSILADFAGQRNHTNLTRQSRDTSNKKALSRERQDHINRLSQLPSRSSSSTRQDNPVAHSNQNHKPRDKNRRPRNSSCERATMSKDYKQSRPKRSISQTSKNSHQSYVDSDSHSGSRNSLVQVSNVTSSQTLITEPHSNMTGPSAATKYNRAFTLRRARLGLGEPSRITDLQQDQLMSPRRAQHQLNQQVSSNTTNLVNFSRADGGRFSLRTKSFVTPSRVPRSYQQANHHVAKIDRELINGYPQSQDNPRSDIDYNSVQQNDLIDDTAYITARMSGLTNLASNNSHFGSSFYKRSPSDMNQSFFKDMVYHHQKHNQIHQNHHSTDPAYAEPSGFGSQERYTDVNNRAAAVNFARLGALDNLVISAISSLSTKLKESVCSLLVHHAKRLPVDDETRSIVEEILPQLSADITQSAKSPTSIEEIDHPSHYELSKTLRNLKKMEQMVGVIGQITTQLSAANASPSPTVTAKLSQRSPASSVKSSNNSNKSEANLSIISDLNNGD